jgi:hypothetical protein
VQQPPPVKAAASPRRSQSPASARPNVPTTPAPKPPSAISP